MFNVRCVLFHFFYAIVKFCVVFVEEIILRAIPVKYGHISTEITKCIQPPQAKRISNYYLVRELFWPLELRIYIFRPMRMIDAILPGGGDKKIKRLCIAPSISFFASSLPAARTDQSTRERTFPPSLSIPGRFQQQTEGLFISREHIQHLFLCFL